MNSNPMKMIQAIRKRAVASVTLMVRGQRGPTKCIIITYILINLDSERGIEMKLILTFKLSKIYIVAVHIRKSFLLLKKMFCCENAFGI